MPRRTTQPKPDDPEQSARFIEAAKRADVDESGKEFERVFVTIVKPAEKIKTGPN